MSILRNEAWRDIPGYEGMYQASSKGRIKSVEGKVTYSKLHGERRWKERILKNRGLPKHGYRVTLYTGMNCELKHLSVARLVGMAFLGVPDDEQITINHKDGNRLNNNIENLEWLSLEDNIKHAFKTGLMPTNTKTRIIENKQVKEFYSMAEASRYLGKSPSYLSNRIKKGQNIYNKNEQKAECHIYKEGEWLCVTK